MMPLGLWPDYGVLAPFMEFYFWLEGWVDLIKIGMEGGP